MNIDIRARVETLEQCGRAEETKFEKTLEELRDLYRRTAADFSPRDVDRIKTAKSNRLNYCPNCDKGVATCQKCKGVGCSICSLRGTFTCPSCCGSGRKQAVADSAGDGTVGFASDAIWHDGPQW